MLVIKKNKFGISYDYIWFAERPSLKNAFGRVVYMQCLDSGPAIGFLRRPFFTKIIDLEQDADTILSETSRSTSYQIKRAIREGVTMVPVAKPSDFVSFYNLFARTKNRSKLTEGELAGWGQEVLGFAALSEGQPLAMHTYLVDTSVARARLLHSASHFRTSDDSSQRNAIARANRFLHYATMLHFKDQGITKYDMGGYAKNSSDPVLQAIARFKDGFGGEVVREDRYVSLPLHGLQAFGRVARHVRSPAQDWSLEPTGFKQ